MSTPRGLGVFQKIFANLRSRVKHEGREAFEVGKDHLGNRFFESPADPARGIRLPKRWYVGASQDSWSNPLPPEWEAWLRYRRDNLPSEEELMRNIHEGEKRKLLAEEIEKRLKPGRAAIPDPLYEKYPSYKDYQKNPMHIMDDKEYKDTGEDEDVRRKVKEDMINKRK